MFRKAAACAAAVQRSFASGGQTSGRVSRPRCRLLRHSERSEESSPPETPRLRLRMTLRSGRAGKSQGSSPWLQTSVKRHDIRQRRRTPVLSPRLGFDASGFVRDLKSGACDSSASSPHSRSHPASGLAASRDVNCHRKQRRGRHLAILSLLRRGLYPPHRGGGEAVSVRGIVSMGVRPIVAVVLPVYLPPGLPRGVPPHGPGVAPGLRPVGNCQVRGVGIGAGIPVQVPVHVAVVVMPNGIPCANHRQGLYFFGFCEMIS